MADKTMTGIRDRIYGSLCGAFVGSAMGAVEEGKDWQDIVAKHGVLKELLAYAHYKEVEKPGSGRMRVAGTTEDGVERIKLLALAIAAKKGRIGASDLAVAWREYINREFFGVQMEPCDEILYNIVESGVPPAYAGWFTDAMGVNSFARSCHPIGLINACNPEGAYRDTFDVGRLYQPLHGDGLDWAAAMACGIAEAMKSAATLDSVVEAGRQALPSNLRPILDRAIELAAKAKDAFELREMFDKIYFGRGIKYSLSRAEEVVPKGFSVFYVSQGSLKDSIIGGVNFGRDTDCCAAVAAGLSGAYQGSRGIPQEWVDQVDKATLENQYTVCHFTIAEHADAIYEALLATKEQMRAYMELLDADRR